LTYRQIGAEVKEEALKPKLANLRLAQKVAEDFPETSGDVMMAMPKRSTRNETFKKQRQVKKQKLDDINPIDPAEEFFVRLFLEFL
jgi:hypothetical protein